MNKRQHCIERSGGLFHGFEVFSRCVDLLNVGVAHPFNARHQGHGLPSSRDQGAGHHGPTLMQEVLGVANPLAEETVARPQMVVEEGQRSADGKGVEPERKLRQLDRHRVLVNAVNDAFEDDPAHQVARLQTANRQRPPVPVPLFLDVSGNGFEACAEGRGVAVAAGFRICHRLQDLVRQPVDEADEEVTRTHRRIADGKVEHSAGRVVRRQCLSVRILRQVMEVGQPFFDQWSDRAADDQEDEVFRRVIGAAGLSCERIRTLDELPFLEGQFMFEQPFVYGAKVLHGQVAVVDVLAGEGELRSRQSVEDWREFSIRDARPVQDRPPLSKESAIVGR
ncbi:MAG: hypothetical protein ACR2JJ_06520 [Sphingomicrobium sp.]